MKRLIAALIILALCLWGSIYADRRVAADCKALSAAFDKVADAAVNQDRESVKLAAEELEKEFENKKDMLCVFSDHDWTEEIDISISGINHTNSFEEIENTCGKSAEVLSHIIDACDPSLPNIF